MIKKSLIHPYGFTLVELMVAISIIGILSSIVYANFGEARKSSRDDIRKTSMKELQLAIEFYKAQNDVYPPAGCSATVAPASGSNLAAQYWANGECGQYITGLIPDYIPALPVDPNNEAGTDIGYMYASNGTNYKLMIKDTVEVKTVVAGDEYSRCLIFSSCGGNGNTYATYSAGAINW